MISGPSMMTWFELPRATRYGTYEVQYPTVLIASLTLLWLAGAIDGLTSSFCSSFV